MNGNSPETPSDWLRSVVARYEGPLVRYAARITGDAERARDVVQDTFLRLCEQDRAELDGRLAQWLYTVCRR
ncbi:MAG TPA: sigma factor, partial [Pirellulales bacterium]|nr:sigma factor [Pirellulales bacterium]